MKKNVFIILAIVIIFSTISVVTMIRDSNSQSHANYATRLECSAQGDLKPESFEQKTVDPNTLVKDQICSNQNEEKRSK